jgi:hypothetical protein
LSVHKKHCTYEYGIHSNLKLLKIHFKKIFTRYSKKHYLLSKKYNKTGVFKYEIIK